jgi:hypothetical protein
MSAAAVLKHVFSFRRRHLLNLLVSADEVTVLLVKINMKAPAAETEKLIDNTTSSGFRCRSRGNSFRAKLTPCGHRSDKNCIYAAKGVKTKFETLQTIEETFQTEKQKKKFNVPSN